MVRMDYNRSGVINFENEPRHRSCSKQDSGASSLWRALGGRNESLDSPRSIGLWNPELKDERTGDLLENACIS